MPITILQISIGSNHSTMETIMTSTTIYTPILPTYLYIKQHSITKKMYFGKTTRPDPMKYKGSGVYWLRHIKKHGSRFVETIWLSDLYYDTSKGNHIPYCKLNPNRKEKPFITCIICGHTAIRSPNFYRYHNDNCRCQDHSARK